MQFCLFVIDEMLKLCESCVLKVLSRAPEAVVCGKVGVT